MYPVTHKRTVQRDGKAGRISTENASRLQARDRIRIEMRLKKISEADLSKALGYKRVYLRAIITGTHTSTPARNKIEKHFGKVFWPSTQTVLSNQDHKSSSSHA